MFPNTANIELITVGLPCITPPLITSANAMPIGVQLVGEVEADDKLFGVAKWLDVYLGQK